MDNRDYFIYPIESLNSWARLVARVSMGHHPQNVKIDYEFLTNTLYVCVHTVDSRSTTGQSYIDVVHATKMPQWHNTDYALRVLRDAVHRALIHEADEFFKVDDIAPFDPHAGGGPISEISKV